jgi:hypothetical protein
MATRNGFPVDEAEDSAIVIAGSPIPTTKSARKQKNLPTTVSCDFHFEKFFSTEALKENRIDFAAERYLSSRTQIFRKLIGSLGSPCACSLMGAVSYFV